MGRPSEPRRLGTTDFLAAFGKRVRGERARRGMTRRLLADHAGISERYIARLEAGKGNMSILLLRRVAAALGIPLARLVDGEAPSPERALLGQLLARLPPDQLREVHASLLARFSGDADRARLERIALIGLRGAGKSTLGKALGKERCVPFLELDREIERVAGAPLASLLELCGQDTYRRFERDALLQVLEAQSRFVLATGGSLVSEPETFELLLRRCFTVWIRTSPEEHMARVLAQGDRRPMAGSDRAMDDLRHILEERAPLYARADLVLDTSGRSERDSLRELIARLGGTRQATGSPEPPPRPSHRKRKPVRTIIPIGKGMSA